MTIRVKYVGTDDARVIERKTLLEKGLSDHGEDLVWDRYNNFQLDLPNSFGMFLLSQGDFRIEEGFRFGDFIADSPRKAQVSAQAGAVQGAWSDVDASSDIAIKKVIPGQWVCLMPDLLAESGSEVALDMWTVVGGIAVNQFSDFGNEGQLGWTLPSETVHIGSPAWYRVKEEDLSSGLLVLRLRAYTESETPRGIKGSLICLGPFGDGSEREKARHDAEAITEAEERLQAEARDVLDKAGIERTAEAIEWLMLVKTNSKLRELEGVDVAALIANAEYLRREEEAELRRQAIAAIEAEEKARGLPHKDRSKKGSAR